MLEIFLIYLLFFKDIMNFFGDLKILGVFNSARLTNLLGNFN